jgi:hypothetical protein
LLLLFRSVSFSFLSVMFSQKENVTFLDISGGEAGFAEYFLWRRASLGLQFVFSVAFAVASSFSSLFLISLFFRFCFLFCFRTAGYGYSLVIPLLLFEICSFVTLFLA